MDEQPYGSLCSVWSVLARVRWNGDTNIYGRSMIVCPHCEEWGAAVCTEAECSIAGPGEPGSSASCRPCWIRLGRKAVEPPSLVRRAFNYAAAIFNYVRKGRPVVSEKEAARRLAICTGGETGSPCDWYNAEKGVCGHVKCGCPLVRKVVLSTEHCPLSPPKW